MTTPSETQSLILSRAATRPGNIALPLPTHLAGAAASTVVTKMITCGWLEEIDANTRCGEPLWRETGDGHGTTLIATAAGLEIIGSEVEATNPVAKAPTAKSKPAPAPTPETPVATAVRAGTKQAQIIAMLQRPEGATVAEITVATGWQAHTVRGAISGALRKKLGLVISAEAIEGRGTVHRLQCSGDSCKD